MPAIILCSLLVALVAGFVLAGSGLIATVVVAGYVFNVAGLVGGFVVGAALGSLAA